jgi:hypothetical protein
MRGLVDHDDREADRHPSRAGRATGLAVRAEPANGSRGIDVAGSQQQAKLDELPGWAVEHGLQVG